jgi:hypothetical protein
MRPVAVWLALLQLPLIGGCSVLAEDPKRGDAEPCETREDCKSGICTGDNLCGASSCDCPGHDCAAKGSRSNDCDARQVCVVSTSIVEDLGMFFSNDSDNDGYCQFPCSGGCPAHYHCDPSADFCVSELGWADPIVTLRWHGDAEGSVSGTGQSLTVPLERGQMVSLEASAHSPIDARLSFAWQLIDESGNTEQTTGVSLDVTLTGEFERAELTVKDDKQHASAIYVMFQACMGAGTACDAFNMSCCGTCNAATGTCQ